MEKLLLIIILVIMCINFSNTEKKNKQYVNKVTAYHQHTINMRMAFIKVNTNFIEIENKNLIKD